MSGWARHQVMRHIFLTWDNFYAARSFDINRCINMEMRHKLYCRHGTVLRTSSLAINYTWYFLPRVSFVTYHILCFGYSIGIYDDDDYCFIINNGTRNSCILDSLDIYMEWTRKASLTAVCRESVFIDPTLYVSLYIRDYILSCIPHTVRRERFFLFVYVTTSQKHK